MKHYDNLLKPDLIAPGNKLIYAESDMGSDGGNPSSAGPSIWHVDDPSFTDCSNIDGDNTIVKGNVVVRP